MDHRSPDFLIIGVQKAATSALQANLARQPGIHLVEGPYYQGEVHFFDNDEVWQRGPWWYRSLFDQPDKLQGEKTPDYLSSPVALERMARVVPDARLVVMLRDPVRRAFSAWNHMNQRHEAFRHLGWEVLPFGQALQRAQQRPESVFGTLLLKGHYFEQLSKLFTLFDRDRVHVGVSERFRTDGPAEFGRLLGWLGADAATTGFEERHVRSYEDSLDPRLAAQLATYFEPHTAALRRLLDDDLEEWERAPGDAALATPAARFGAGKQYCFLAVHRQEPERLQHTVPEMLRSKEACAVLLAAAEPPGDVAHFADPGRLRTHRPARPGLARAMNSALRGVDSAWIVLLDGRVKVHADLSSPKAFTPTPGEFYMMHAGTGPHRSRLLMARLLDLRAIGLFDETLEDLNAIIEAARLRLCRIGLRERTPAVQPSEWLGSLGEGRGTSAHAFEAAYVRLVRDVERFGLTLTAVQRERLHQTVRSAFQSAAAGQAPPVPARPAGAAARREHRDSQSPGAGDQRAAGAGCPCAEPTWPVIGAERARNRAPVRDGETVPLSTAHIARRSKPIPGKARAD